jgi:hypothetical protein
MKPKSYVAQVQRRYSEPHVDRETEQRLVHFLLTHGRLERREGRPAMHVLGRYKNFDDTIDYSIRTRVPEADGKSKLLTSHIREYPSGRMRLIR